MLSLAGRMPLSSLDLAVGNNAFAALVAVAPTLSALPDFVSARDLSPLGSVMTPPVRTTMNGIDRSVERSMFLELAWLAMDELVKMSQLEEPLWVAESEGGKEVLNYDEYSRVFTRRICPKEAEFVSEAMRESGTVIIKSMALVDTLKDAMRMSFSRILGVLIMNP